MIKPTLTLSIAAGLLAAGTATAKPTIPAGARYVSMGSSFAAGPGTGELKPETPARCTRSQANYPTLLAQRLHLDLVDATCGGATTAHILGPWNELPAQLDAVSPETRLVTITIGGNDVNFVRNLHGAECSGKATSAEVRAKCTQSLLPGEADWTKLSGNLRDIVRRIRRTAPAARVIFVDYQTVLPHGRACPAVPFDATGLATMRAQAARLASVTASAARAERAEVLHAGALSRSHSPCDAQPWMVGSPGSAPGTPYHPNAAGMRAVADALARRLGG
jgi:lysophospholipase L1-like esterase